MTRRTAHPALGDLELVGQPIEIDGAEFEIVRPAPDPGEHTDEILGELGYEAAEIEDLRQAGIV
jgi:crotonobetainyl-CoA:carnitine CoA-transferase CaiB-like acyl-CoA transferase